MFAALSEMANLLTPLVKGKKNLNTFLKRYLFKLTTHNPNQLDLKYSYPLELLFRVHFLQPFVHLMTENNQNRHFLRH
jgi:hypothetical protein